MNILVLNGSPAGKNSVTLQTVEYLQACGRMEHCQILDVGQRIKGIEKDFSEAEELLKQADLILFVYPVYTFLVPSQLHRFIELIKEKQVDISGKYAAQITTSKHFYDMTAHRFIEDNCYDLGLKYIGGLSADMDDLLHDKGQKEAEDFFSFVLWNMDHGTYKHSWIQKSTKEKRMASVHGTNTMTRRGNAAIVYDDPEDANPYLQAMLERFQNRLSMNIRRINLHEFPFAGGCLGCFHCASDGTCVYRDGFDTYLRENINSAAVVIYAFTIKDHAMGSRFKMYDDRQFCNGHRTVTMGKPTGYIIDGILSAEENLRTVIEARAEVGGNFLAGIACDEDDPDQAVDQLADTVEYAVYNNYRQPKNFYGVGGLKIFRDLIYQMQGLMKEDHRFYKEHGFYDFPQKKKAQIIVMYLVSSLMNNKTLRKKIPVNMTEGMLMPYKAVIEKTRKKQKIRK